MIIACLHCKTDLLIDATTRVLATCPHCDFVFAVSPGSRGEVPTFAEESSLQRIDAKSAATTVAGAAPDSTRLGDSSEIFGVLAVPAGKILYVEVVEAPAAGPEKGTIFRFAQGRMVFGRTDGDVRLEDERISRKHAVIEAISRENIYLKDLASTNGTFLNGQRVGMKKLVTGDIVRLGGISLRFHASDA